MLKTVASGGCVTWKTQFESAAGSQLPFPACDATMLTVPVPVKVSAVPPEIDPGPAPTANATGSPLEAVAASETQLVDHWSAIGGKSIVWLAGSTVTLTSNATAS